MSKKKLIGIIGACVIVAIVVVIIATRPTPTYTLSLNVSPSGAGSVSPSGGQYASGVQITLTASPASSYQFSNWTGDVDTVANVSALSTTITIKRNCAVVANFEQKPVHIPDPNLEAAIRETIDKPTGSIYRSDVEAITFLSAGHSNITILVGLEYCTNLRELGLCCNQISDMSPLSNLTKLEMLSIEENQISDVSSLENLVNLTNLWIEDNQITDISSLANLTNLEYLGLGHNHISDISVLASLVNLGLLSLEDNQISDISPLVDNPGLGEEDYVFLENNPLSSRSVNIYIPQLEARWVFVDY